MHIDVDTLAPWTSDWLWALPISVITVVIHVLGLLGIKQAFERCVAQVSRRSLTLLPISLIAGTTVCVTLLHGVEATIWTLAYRMLHAIPNPKEAALYSLNAMTTFGHSGFVLAGQWHLMGSLEALNGWILFGLSTAFLYAIIQEVWALGGPELLHRRL